MCVRRHLLDAQTASLNGAALERTATVLHRTVAVTAVQLERVNVQRTESQFRSPGGRVTNAVGTIFRKIFVGTHARPI